VSAFGGYFLLNQLYERGTPALPLVMADPAVIARLLLLRSAASKSSWF
jgi:hypothetical protein